MKCRNCGIEFKSEGSGNFLFCSIGCRRLFNVKTIRDRPIKVKRNINVNVFLSIDEAIAIDECRGTLSRAAFVRNTVFNKVKEMIDK